MRATRIKEELIDYADTEVHRMRELASYYKQCGFKGLAWWCENNARKMEKFIVSGGS
uniref:Uncharacterized protein n=1 Tax=viral metagenome TaxID=1070528 RepID=A0A6M3LIY7_9ZZZZ